MSINVLMVVDFLLIAEGTYMAATGKSIGNRDSVMKYTEESYKTYNKAQGVILLAAGTVLFAFHILGLFPEVITGVCAMIGVIGAMCCASLLVNKALLN